MFHELARTTKEGFKKNAIPGFFLQIVALTIVLLYYFVPASHGVFDLAAGIKTQGGYFYSSLATAFFGGFVPFVYLSLSGRIAPKDRIGHGTFLVIFWAVQGMVVDTLYTQQARWFGSGAEFETIVKKVLVDQGPFNLLWATPTTILLYGWKDSDFSLERFREKISARTLLYSYVSVQVNAWFLWIPCVAIIYSL
ncbi:MAG: hypothetical protein GF344_17950, partial [Chitinivibrionales bacterium]|nr:hypothetical protein [Chitinivibrionales bacterium]MBD3358540.1 hypothetical protein [Chitinivibrionales bacterium]